MRAYRTVQDDALDLVAFREYGTSSKTTEALYDHNYRIADYPILMPAGIIVELPPMSSPPLRKLIRLWDSMTCGIYLIETRAEQFYIGSSIAVEFRIRGHFSKLRRGMHRNKKLQRSFDKHGGSGRVLIVCRREELLLYEQRCFDILKPPLNIFLSADRSVVPPETLAARSAALKGRAPWNKGKSGYWTPDERWRQIRRDRLLGNTIWVGRRHSDATRQKMRAAALGKRPSERCVRD